ARSDGAFGHWYGKSIHKITFAEIQDWHSILGGRVNPHNGKTILREDAEEHQRLFPDVLAPAQGSRSDLGGSSVPGDPASPTRDRRPRDRGSAARSHR